MSESHFPPAGYEWCVGYSVARSGYFATIWRDREALNLPIKSVLQKRDFFSGHGKNLEEAKVDCMKSFAAHQAAEATL